MLATAGAVAPLPEVGETKFEQKRERGSALTDGEALDIARSID